MPNRKTSTPNSKVFAKASRIVNKAVFNKGKKFGIVAIILVILLTLSTSVVASYTSFDLPLVSKGVQRKVDYLIASVPAIPKTPKQILIKALEDSRNIKTAKEVFNFSFKSDDQKFASVTVEARLDTSDLNNTALEAEVTGKVSQERQEPIVDLNLIEEGSDLFFKLDKVPTIPGYNFNSLLGKWFRIDLEKASEEIGVQVLEDENIKSDVEAKIEEVFEVLDETNALKKIKRLPDEKIAGEDSYHLSLVAEIGDLVKISQKLIPESDISENEVENIFEEARIYLWVDKKTHFVNKLEVDLKLKEITSGVALQILPTNKQLEASFSYVLSEINKPIKIKTPQNVQELTSFVELLIMIQPTSSNLLLQEQIFGVSTQTRGFGSNMLFYERLLRVLTLFPNTI